MHKEYAGFLFPTLDVITLQLLTPCWEAGSGVVEHNLNLPISGTTMPFCLEGKFGGVSFFGINAVSSIFFLPLSPGQCLRVREGRDYQITSGGVGGGGHLEKHRVPPPLATGPR